MMNMLYAVFTEIFVEWFRGLKKRIRKAAGSYGFTCDGCGAELFDYPVHRLCKTCEDGLRLNNGRTCDKCGRKTLAEGVCLSCKGRAPRFDKGISPFVYRGESASFVNRIKTSNPTLALYFAEKMAECFIERFVDAERFLQEDIGPLLLIPVPLTKARMRERGYNQAELLAERVSDVLQEKGYRVELREDILLKKKDTAQQKHMDFASRLENVAGAYHIAKRKECRGRTVLLIDDILTTGATGSECASRLLSAGADRVVFLTGASLPEQK